MKTIILICKSCHNINTIIINFHPSIWQNLSGTSPDRLLPIKFIFHYGMCGALISIITDHWKLIWRYVTLILRQTKLPQQPTCHRMVHQNVTNIMMINIITNFCLSFLNFALNDTTSIHVFISKIQWLWMTLSFISQDTEIPRIILWFWYCYYCFYNDIHWQLCDIRWVWVEQMTLKWH